MNLKTSPQKQFILGVRYAQLLCVCLLYWPFCHGALTPNLFTVFAT